MAAITSKVDICNMALGHLGNLGTVENIDTPSNDKETTFALWYDITRQTLLKNMVPNFALGRTTVARDLVNPPAFGYLYAYSYPTAALKVLGLGNLDEKGDTDFSVEGNRIYTNSLYDAGMPVRYIKDVTLVNDMSPEFKMLLALYLAEKVALPLTQDKAKKKMIADMLPREMTAASGINAQENQPVRRSYSRFRAARHSDPSRNPSKK